MVVTLRRFALCALASSSAVSACKGATTLANGYSVRVWVNEDGLPQNVVTSAVQTSDGYLWFGTPSGLSRFDGERFRVFNSITTEAIKDNHVTRLFEDDGKRLWIAQESGALTVLENGRFSEAPVPLENSHIAENIIGLGGDRENRLWAMRGNGSVDSLLDGRRIQSPITIEEAGIMAWTRSTGGEIWLAENCRAFRLGEHGLQALNIDYPKDRYEGVRAVAASAKGGVWIFSDNRIRRWDEEHWIEDLGTYPDNSGSISCALELRDGTVAVGTIFSGLYLVSRDGKPTLHFDQSNGLPQNWVRFLYEDQEATLWLGAGSAGLASLHTSAFSVLQSPDNWGGCSVFAVAPGANNSLWVGTDGAALYHYSNNQWKHFGESEGLSNSFIRSVAESPSGEVWASNYWLGAPYRLNGRSFERPANISPSSSPANALFWSASGDKLFIGNRDGLLVVHGNETKTLLTSAEIPASDLCALAEAQDGSLWCGFSRGGLVHLKDGVRTHFGKGTGLDSDSVSCLAIDDQGAVWIGTADNGINRIKDGCYAHVGVEQGLIDNAICAILDDQNNYFWLSTHHGIQRLSLQQLNQCADGLHNSLTGQAYTRSDGLPTSEFVGGLQSSGCRTEDGKLWFASSKGPLCVDPARSKFNNRAPPVDFDSLVVDEKPVMIVNKALPNKLPPYHRRLEFRFNALSYVDPSKVLFKYRLDGIDQDWVDAGPHRNATYSRLPAAHYRFRVKACNNDGVWNENGNEITFVVAPYFWQTGWFLVFTAGAGTTAVVLIVRHVTRRRLQRRLDQLKQENMLERERARIARDIHDDLGSSLTKIAMLSQPCDRNSPNGIESGALRGIYSTARDAVRSLDETVWAISPKHDTLEGLCGYIGKYAQDFLAASHIRCRLDMQTAGHKHPVTAETRHNLFLAAKEVLNNTVKHANATEVRITLTAKEEGFELYFADNGKGIAPGNDAEAQPHRLASGNGVENLTRRLALIGGTCLLSTTPGSGTTVAFKIDSRMRSKQNSGWTSFHK